MQLFLTIWWHLITIFKLGHLLSPICRVIRTYQSAALLPIAFKMLQNLITALEKIVNSYYDKKLLKAMFVIMYFCCLRIGEVALSNHDDHVIQISQVSFSQVDSVFHSFTIQFNSFKMFQAFVFIIWWCLLKMLRFLSILFRLG